MNAFFRFNANAPIWIDPPMETPRVTPSVLTVYNKAVAFGIDLLSTADINATGISGEKAARTKQDLPNWQHKKTE